MDPEVRQEFDEIRAILREQAEYAARRHQEAMQRMDRAEKRMDRAEQRMDRFDKRVEGLNRDWRDRMDKFERQRQADLAEMKARDEKYDRKFEATKKLVEAGIKIVTRYIAQTNALTIQVRELTKEQKALNRSLQNGHNGHHGRGRGNGFKRRGS